MRYTILIRSIRQSNYLQENGIYPIKEFPDGDLYVRTKKLLSLLDRFEIASMIGKKPFN